MRDYAMVMSNLVKDLSRYLPKDLDSNPLSLTARADLEGWTDQEVAAGLQVQALYKKLAPDGQSPSAIDATLKKFSDVNSKVGFLPPHSGDNESMTYMLNVFRDEVWKVLDYEIDGRNFDLKYISDHFAAGPGASRGADSRNFYTKLFDSHHTYTDPFVLALFRAAVSGSATWQRALGHWSRKYRSKMVRGNTLFTVPKNAEISRTCCTEPLLNMLMQKALGTFTEMRAEAKLGINLARQPDLNRELARRGSIDGSFGTTDQSSASDSISVSLCEWACPPCYVKWLMRFRSPHVLFPDGHEEALNMISTMGNGFTFPLETVLFACAIRAAYISKGVKPYFSGPRQNCSVFGDDVIVREDCFVATNALLERLGFTVNVSKSFNVGSFRESCGFDYWNGRNVRPVFVESLETPQDVYSAFNRLARWSAENRLPIGRTLFAISRMARFLPVPFSEADDVGFKVPSYMAPWLLDDKGWRLYRYLKPKSTVEKVPADLTEAKRLGYRDFNPDGWELCFLGSYARNPQGTFYDPITGLDIPNERQDDGIHRRPYQGEELMRKRRTNYIPHWDWLGAVDRGRFDPDSFHYWEVVVASTFG